MSTEASELHRIISASVRDMLDAYRIQTQAGPVTEKALEEILFRGAHGVVQSHAPYSGEQRVALLPSVVRMLLATFLEEVAGADGAPHAKKEGRAVPTALGEGSVRVWAIMSRGREPRGGRPVPEGASVAYPPVCRKQFARLASRA